MTQSLPPAELSPAESLPGEEQWSRLNWLPCEITVDLPAAHFSVRDLLQLREGSVIGTSTRRGADLPMRVNGQLIGWVEFEPVAEHLAVRITELI